MESKIQTEDESSNRAVSPVIGVILMVAITVILAAVIAAFVLDLGQGQSSNVNAAVGIENSSSGVTFSLTDTGNAEYVEIRYSNGTAVEKNDSVVLTSSPDLPLDNTGESVELANNESYSAVAVSGDDETQVGSYSP